jgi:hypothetical protein
MPSSTLLTSLAADAAVALTAAYQLNGSDRRYIDDQIRACQQALIDCAIAGRQATYLRVGSASAAVAVGDVLCVAVTDAIGLTVTRAVAAALATSDRVWCIALTAAPPGGRVLVATGGILPSSIVGMATDAAGYVRCNTTTARCERVASLSIGDYPVGYWNGALGGLSLGPAPALVAATSTSPGLMSAADIVRLYGVQGSSVQIPTGSAYIDVQTTAALLTVKNTSRKIGWDVHISQALASHVARPDPSILCGVAWLDDGTVIVHSGDATTAGTAGATSYIDGTFTDGTGWKVTFNADKTATLAILEGSAKQVAQASHCLGNIFAQVDVT